MFTSVKILGSKLRKALAQLPNLPRALALVWQAARPWTIPWVVLLIIQGLLPAALVYLTKLFVDALILALRIGGSWPEMRDVLTVVLMLGGVLLLMEVVRHTINWVSNVQAELLQDHITTLIHEKSVTVDLAFYDLADYYDHLHRARAEARYRPVALLGNLGALLQNSITLVAMGAILIPLGPGLAVVLMLSTLPAFFVVIHYALEEYQWRQRTTADDRRAWYYDWIMTTAEAAAEIRLFGLGKYFQSNHKDLRRRLRGERLRLTRRQVLGELAASLIALLIVGAALALMVWRTLMSRITPGELALILAAFNQGQGLMRTLLENAGQLYGNSLFLGNLFEFLAMQPVIADGGESKEPELRVGIEFKRVSFSYPDASGKALDDFTMTIPQGKIVAIVGPNGAGKSTLLKLLCRFYNPDDGAIEIDGLDLKTIAVEDLRRMITVLFQQPFHYNATVQENILYGDLNRTPPAAEVDAAIEAAGAEEIVARLPEQEQTLLGRWFAGGTELSVGEWQRIALARAFLRRAPIIILDEPTSALDPWAEADWLERFRELAAGRTSIIITHRFTTAMRADIIHVMDRGRIVESGSHQRLLEQSGLYAESWSRQIMAATDYADSVDRL
ncbi:MAG TPA: ABC transporter ATP-binding protein [Pyrinomonadaceae bacterium]|jgi:ATP-binding cassette subfamily B protein|nr:ABC transporter ATP-binding protein [Pyrinomonadaceae bacterium]